MVTSLERGSLSAENDEGVEKSGTRRSSPAGLSAAVPGRSESRARARLDNSAAPADGGGGTKQQQHQQHHLQTQPEPERGGSTTRQGFLAGRDITPKDSQSDKSVAFLPSYPAEAPPLL